MLSPMNTRYNRIIRQSNCNQKDFSIDLLTLNMKTGESALYYHLNLSIFLTHWVIDFRYSVEYSVQVSGYIEISFQVFQPESTAS